MKNIKENIYIVGHTKPDLDSIASAMAYQKFREGIGEFNYFAIRCDTVNPLTEWVFEKYNTPIPQLIPDITGLNIVLVDHTYERDRAKGWENANIIEVIDHHDVKLEDIIPQRLTIRPCGSTTTLVVEKIFNANIPLSRDIAHILLSGILDDTLGLKSPTTIQIDIDMASRLNNICNIKDIWGYSREIFTKKDIWHTLTNSEIIDMDIRNIDIKDRRVSISQVETLDYQRFDIEGLINEMNILNVKTPFDLRLVMLTDVEKYGCMLLIVGKDIKLFENLLNTKIVNNRIFLPNIVSRKKQITPFLEEMYKGV